MVRLGRIISYISGFLIWIYYAGSIIGWTRSIFGHILGNILGFFISVGGSPGILIFPLIYKWIEGVWPGDVYFLLFGVMWLGLFISLAGGRLTGELD